MMSVSLKLTIDINTTKGGQSVLKGKVWTPLLYTERILLVYGGAERTAPVAESLTPGGDEWPLTG